MRNNMEDAKLYDPRIEMGLRLRPTIISGIAAATTLDDDMGPLVFAALASAQNLIMPPLDEGLTFIIVNNSGAANTATIKDVDTTTTRGTIAQNAAAIVTCDGVRWWVLPLT